MTCGCTTTRRCTRLAPAPGRWSRCSCWVPAVPAPPNRARFLAESLADLRQQFRARGADLIIRHGDPAAEVIRLAGQTGAQAVHIAADVSRYAARRQQALARDCERQRLELTVSPGLTVVPPGDLTPASGDHYRVFTPYWRAWRAAAWRRHCPVPDTIAMPKVDKIGRLPAAVTDTSPGLAPGGEQEGRKRFAGWRQQDLAGYPDHHDDLPGDQTSRLSPYLRFGCVSPLEVAIGALDRPGGEEFCRQLAWRDFFHQVTAACPDLATGTTGPAPRPGTTKSRTRWPPGQRQARTGIQTIVDAGLRQLAAEEFMHNRARMVTASFLTRNLGIDWRHGYRHFFALLADGDVANNAGNWQWVAGTGNNTRPNRVMNPLRQAGRLDKAGDYVRRYVPELAGLPAAGSAPPWRLDAAARRGWLPRSHRRVLRP